MADIHIGFQRLVERHQLRLVQPLFTRSRIGTRLQREEVSGREVKTWTPSYQPEDSLRGHFEFGLKYERLNLEFFSRLFATIDPEEVADWVRQEPSGIYARRTAFYFEWITGRELPVPDCKSTVGYVDALPADLYLTAARSERNRRWRVNNNMPGTPAFCPVVYLGPAQQRDWIYDVTAGVKELDDLYGAEILLRSSAWLTFKESRASFAIEHEADQEDRVKRFAAVIQEYSGHLEDAMSPVNLDMLQKAVLGEAALRTGVRQSPVFVGESTFRGQIVHYVAPSEGDVEPMLDALRELELRTRGVPGAARIAAISFGFVYLHPLADGNGRIHRFLINHLLAGDGLVPPTIIVPVSATIAGTARARAEYDQVLETISKPFMKRYADGFRFGEPRKCPDGVTTDFEFLQTEDAGHVWRFLDLTAHTRYLSAVLRQTVEHEMAEEAQLLRQNDRARAAIKRVVEMPDQDADRIIRSLKEGNWTVSNKLRKTLPEIFQNDGKLHARQERIIDAVKTAFEDT